MNPELSWLPGWLSFGLLVLPAAFALGWLASRLDWRQLRLEDRRNPRAYFRGLNFLLNEQQDQAIDAFIEAVQNDPDTSELHFALGNLFRRRGDYERAVRVHQHLLSRGDLSQAEHQRAQHALALDYLKAGLLDHAENALLKLEGTPFQTQARLARLANYERARDWPQAAAIARSLDGAQDMGVGAASGAQLAGSFAPRLAHYLCEQAAERLASKDVEGAQELLRRAIQTAPPSPRPRIELARLQMQRGQAADTDGARAEAARQACETLLAALDASPAAAPLIAAPLVKAAQASGQETSVQARLRALYEQAPALDLLEALIALQAPLPDTASGTTPPDDLRGWYLHHLRHESSLAAASKWLAGEKLDHEEQHPLVQRALDRAAQPLLRYRCAACGFEAKQHFWQCPGCQSWDSYPARRVEEL
jgi:lipopolysaccharide biosynthesis regulator YciM